MICALVLHLGCLMKKTSWTKERSRELWNDVVNRIFTDGKWYIIKEIELKN